MLAVFFIASTLFIGNIQTFSMVPNHNKLILNIRQVYTNLGDYASLQIPRSICDYDRLDVETDDLLRHVDVGCSHVLWRFPPVGALPS